MGSTQEILQKEIGRLRRFAYSITGNMADADDLVHDVVVKALEKGLPEGRDPVPWLITLCKNIWIDQLRYREVRMRREHEEELPTAMTKVSEQEDAIHMERVLISLQTLPENQRLTLSLVAIEGMSYAETAEFLGVPIGTIMSRIARAREAMLNNFDDSTEARASI